MNRDEWEHEHQHFEASWWSDCANTFGEETKQIAYAKVMGMDPGPWKGGDHWPKWKLNGRSVIDIGGGPVSMLLKCTGFSNARVVDPCDYPDWTLARYEEHGVEFTPQPAEDVLPRLEANQFDEAWCYNCLQHVQDPGAIVREMRRVAKVVRIFEWVEQEAYLGHPHVLHAADMADLLGVKESAGTHVWLDEQYKEIGPDSDSPVRQHAWGGSFK